MNKSRVFSQTVLHFIIVFIMIFLTACNSDPAASESAEPVPTEAAAEEAPVPLEEPTEEATVEETTNEEAVAEEEAAEAEAVETEGAEEEAVETEDAEAEPEVMAAVLDKIFYGDTWTWPYQTTQLAHMARGKFYIPIQDENKIAIIDPDAEDYGLSFVETEYVQPHHPWMAPGMRYNWINFQSEGKGDHDVIAVLDTFTDEIVKYIQTGTNDPFHMAFSPTENVLVTADLDGAAGRVHLFDTVAQELIASIETTGIQTRDIVISHDGRHAFIGHQGYDPDNGVLGQVDVLDIAKQEIVASLGEGRCRSGKMSNSGKYAFYSCGRTDQILVIDTETLEEVKYIQTPEGSNPFNISFRGDDKYAYVGLLGTGQLGIIDMEQLEMVKMLDSGTNTNSTYMHPYAPVAITTNDGTDAHISVIDIENNEIIEKIDTGGKSSHNGQWSPDGRWFVVTNRLGDSVTLLTYNEESGAVEWVDDITVGFGANGVHWAPYFCGVDELTNENVADATNSAAVDGSGACGA